MLVYSDRFGQVATRAALRAITATLRQAESCPDAPTRYEALTEAFLAAAGVWQGIADAEFEALGCDAESAAQAAAAAATLAIGRKLAACTTSGGASAGPPASLELLSLAMLPLPAAVTVRQPEGYAFYAVYPEAYLKAAAQHPWPSRPLVIGLRSIGTGLAALVAAATGASEIVTLRPCGPPFRRELRLSDKLKTKLAAHAGPFAVADEGPGLSGSSFQAAADLLASLGVRDDRITFLPSHHGAPGAEAQPGWLARWAAAQRCTATLDDLLADAPIAGWFEDLTGPVVGVDDFSGGAWRALTRHAAPAFPAQERRKFRLRTASGAWLARFAGLGEIGRRKLARAQALHQAGFAPEPLGFRRGFLLERWEASAHPPDRQAILDRLGPYLGFRARSFPAPDAPRASLELLGEMVGANAGEAAAVRFASLAARTSAITPIHVDGRLHAWEWLTTPEGLLLKADAVDHSEAHDLVGCQDVAWDVAGARVEHGLDAAAVERVCGAIELACGRPVGRSLVQAMEIAYAAFQLGLWTYAGDERQTQRYRDHLSRLQVSG